MCCSARYKIACGTSIHLLMNYSSSEGIFVADHVVPHQLLVQYIIREKNIYYSLITRKKLRIIITRAVKNIEECTSFSTNRYAYYNVLLLTYKISISPTFSLHAGV